jgi:putative resolvase
MVLGPYLSIGSAAALLGVCSKTLRRWEQVGKLCPAFRTPGGHRRYHRTGIFTFVSIQSASNRTKAPPQSSLLVRPRAAIYGRVSATKQKKTGDLDRQLIELKQYCADKGYLLTGVYSDVASGLNDNRKGLLALLRGVAVGKFEVLVVNYNDRLARFSLQILREFLTSWGVRLEVLHPIIVQSSVHAELITDLTAILYSFMGKLYRLRRSKQSSPTDAESNSEVG